MPCPGCGVRLAPEMGLCPDCGRPLHPPKSPFGALELELADLRARYGAGTLPPAQYESAVIDLQLRDRSGGAWWLNGSGRWAHWDGARWVTAVPPMSAARRRARRWWIPAAGAALMLALGALAAAVVVYGGWTDYNASPMLVEDLPASHSPGLAFALQPDQQATLDENGEPEGFSILFFDRRSADGGLEDVRQETWDYYSQGQRLTFVNGVLDEQEPLNLETSSDLLPLRYRPDQFTAYMSLDDVLASAGVTRYLVVPLERDVLADGSVYYAEGLTFGLKDGELRYVEALAVEGEG